MANATGGPLSNLLDVRFRPQGDIRRSPRRDWFVADSGHAKQDTAERADVIVDLGESMESPTVAPARRPPAWVDDLEPMPGWDLTAQPDLGFEFDQRIS